LRKGDSHEKRILRIDPRRCRRTGYDHAVTFSLIANPKFAACLKDPNSTEPPTATATVVRGSTNDTLHLRVEHVKPGLAFDLFTVQRSQFLPDKTVDPTFTNFGMAWYQSDVEANKKGRADVEVKTILLDQIFGFDPDAQLPPTNTFHLGFWFNDPKDAAACGFNPAKPTPFNGDHNAGPMAMMSVPDAKTQIGPLCTDPQYSGNTIKCNP
jgi:hypothetical protein